MQKVTFHNRFKIYRPSDSAMIQVLLAHSITYPKIFTIGGSCAETFLLVFAIILKLRPIVGVVPAKKETMMQKDVLADLLVDQKQISQVLANTFFFIWYKKEMLSQN